MNTRSHLCGLRVRRVMSSLEDPTWHLSLDTGIADVMRLLTDTPTESILVVTDATGRLLGVIGMQHIMAALFPYDAFTVTADARIIERAAGIPVADQTAGDIMLRDCPFTTPDQLVGEAVRIMLHAHCTSLPVVDRNGILLGRLSMRDIAAHAALAVKCLSQSRTKPIERKPSHTRRISYHGNRA